MATMYNINSLLRWGFFTCSLLLVVFLPQESTVQGVTFQDCGSSSGQLDSISVTGCDDTSISCIFTKGQNASINATFSSSVSSPEVDLKVTGIIGGVPVPFNITPKNACGTWGVHCPVASGSSGNNLAVVMPIKTDYPSIGLQVRIELKDSSATDLICVQFPVKIQPPPSKTNL